LNALFHRAAVVVEADSDRAFYEEINLRLQAQSPPGGSLDCCFLNANGKDSLDRIVSLLRRAGVPTVAIADLDLLSKGKLGPLLQAAGMPDDVRNSIVSRRSTLTETTDERKLKTTGLSGARSPGPLMEVLATLADHGVFLVPVGEVEGWLSHLGARGHGPRWLTDIFTRMGSDPLSASYVSAGTDDVWDFMTKAAGWIADPDRKGMPAPPSTEALH
jgi:hypothetical protein